MRVQPAAIARFNLPAGGLFVITFEPTLSDGVITWDCSYTALNFTGKKHLLPQYCQ